ncbi:phage portal protein [Virgibacillus halophilus]|uniref:Phage portal protein n=1 Tax=Tigheibacillus halophilus TaxID=361280 RepID=A0ABU5C875_9BACI|nr:phage portal protein [Virgibacillus halophilus]
MKLFALEQMRAIKERLFKKSLRDRYRLINNIMSMASEGEFDVNDLSISFTENLPKAVDKEIDWFSKMGGQLSLRTMLSQLSFVENPDEEMEQIEEENKLNQELYGFPKECAGGDRGCRGGE